MTPVLPGTLTAGAGKIVPAVCISNTLESINASILDRERSFPELV
jgi:hypothetical protein